jgi:hypothetical protein
MVIEQNRRGLRVVTLEEFSTEDSTSPKGQYSLRRVQYGESP